MTLQGHWTDVVLILCLFSTTPHLLFQKHLFSRRTTDCLHLVSQRAQHYDYQPRSALGEKTSFTHAGDENTHGFKEKESNAPAELLHFWQVVSNLCQAEVHLFFHCSKFLSSTSSQDSVTPPLCTYQTINNKRKASKKWVAWKKQLQRKIIFLRPI